MRHIERISIETGWLKNDIVEKLCDEFGGIASEMLLRIRLLAAMTEGYYVRHNKQLEDNLKAYDGENVREMIERAVELGYFSRKLYRSSKILSNKTMQNAWFHGKRMSREVTVQRNWMLLNPEDYANVKIID